MITIQASFLFTQLMVRNMEHKITDDDLIRKEIWFYAGVSLGGLLSVVLYLTCF